MDEAEELSYKLQQIQKTFNVPLIKSLVVDKKYIQQYYGKNKWAYSLFHNFSDYVHMGISRGGHYKKEDLLEPAIFVEKYIKNLKAVNVLELATGRGAISAYLAKKFNNVQFEGIDISQEQLEFARKKAKKLRNFNAQPGDYHNLQSFRWKFDIVFIVEALCHTLNKEIVLAEVYKILKKNGVFIIFDGYLKKKESDLDENESIAALITAKAMGVSKFQNYDEFVRSINKTSFEIIYEEDVSAFILPTLVRFERLAKTFFNHPFLAKAISRLFPPEFVYNAIAGYLMPNMIKMGVGCYKITILRK